MMPSPVTPGLCCLVPLVLAAALVGCGTSATSPSTQVPQHSPELSSVQASEESGSASRNATSQDATSATVDDDNSIYFATGTARVDEAGQKKLRVHASRLKEDPAQVVSLAGSTDDTGSRAYNLAIAEQRIEAVAKILHSYGVPKRQIHPVRRYGVGRGRSEPACRTAGCRQMLRRVELVYPQ